MTVTARAADVLLGLAPKDPAPPLPPPPEAVRSILVFAHTGLGNFVLFTPALRALRRAFPEARLVVQDADPGWGAAEVVRGSPEVDELLLLPAHLSRLRRAAFLREIRRRRFDLVVAPFDAARFRYLALETAASGARWRVGHVSGGSYRSAMDRVYNVAVPVRDDRHEVDLKADLVEALAVPVTDRATWVHVPPEADAAARRLLVERRVPATFVALQPGAANAAATAKRWPEERFGSLVPRLVRELDADLVLLGDAGEQELCAHLARDGGARVHSLAGATTVQQAAAVLRRARLLVCHDSGLMHLAEAAGTPVAAIYGPTDYRRTAPRDARSAIARNPVECSPCILFDGEGTALACSHHSCIRGVTEDAVVEAALRVARATAAPSGPPR